MHRDPFEVFFICSQCNSYLWSDCANEHQIENDIEDVAISCPYKCKPNGIMDAPPKPPLDYKYGRS